ncbi:unnamed protein product [Strongylus vulgaris]|uniref:Uncharacterized protein n=1 Tax=Strongylus vulgaris TaxID=40348 RepID=A0A3P7K5Q2_STRVU|nr:unnamed protein product [Strongylus vulgaris]
MEFYSFAFGYHYVYRIGLSPGVGFIIEIEVLFASEVNIPEVRKYPGVSRRALGFMRTSHDVFAVLKVPDMPWISYFAYDVTQLCRTVLYFFNIVSPCVCR